MEIQNSVNIKNQLMARRSRGRRRSRKLKYITVPRGGIRL